MSGRQSAAIDVSIRKLFEEVRQGRVSPDEAVARMRHMPFEDLGFAKVDHHRALRLGICLLYTSDAADE